MSFHLTRYSCHGVWIGDCVTEKWIPALRRMAVRDHDQVVRRRVGRDLQRLGEAAAPVDVRLQDIERAGVDETLEAPAGVFVLGAGERNGDLVLDPPIAVDAVGHDAFFQPARAVLRDPAGEVDDVRHVHRLPAIQHDVVVLAERLAQRAHQLDVLVHALGAAHRAMPEEPFLRGVALCLVLPARARARGRDPARRSRACWRRLAATAASGRRAAGGPAGRASGP